MSWQHVVGHEKQKRQFRNAIQQNRLASSFLFVGAAGIGKYTFAKELAKALLCETRGDQACDQCAGCTQVDADTHPDFLQVRRRADKNRLLIEQFVGEKEKRGREGLCHDISLTPFAGGRKVAVIDDADFLNVESANSLLKTLEEPPADSVMILIGTSEQKQLPTIRSRCQIIRFDTLAQDELKSILLEKQLADEVEDVDGIVACGAGSVQMALQMADPEVMNYRNLMIEQFATLDPGDNDFTKVTSNFVDAAGKEAALRRDRLRLASEFAISFYRNLLWAIHGREFTGDSEMNAAIERARQHDELNPAAIADCLDRCFEVQQHVAANANQASVIESWLIDLGRLGRGKLTV